MAAFLFFFPTLVVCQQNIHLIGYLDLSFKKYDIFTDSWLILYEVVLDGWAGEDWGLKIGQ